MWSEELHVQDDKNTLKKAAGETQPDFVEDNKIKKVDEFVEELTDAAKNAKNEHTATYKQKIDKARTEDQTKEIKDKIREDKQATESATIEQATMKAFINSAPSMVNAIRRNLVNNFDKIGTIEWYPKIETFIEAKNAFEADVNKFKALPNYNEMIQADKEARAKETNSIWTLEDNITALQNIIDLKQIANNPTYANKFTEAQLETLADRARKSIREKNPSATPEEMTQNDALIKIITDKQTEIKDKETTTLNSLLDATPSLEIATNLFEKNQSARNALLAKKWGKKSGTASTDKQQLHFEKLLTLYAKTNQEVDTYAVKNYKDTNPEPKYNYIQVKFKGITAVAEDKAKNQKEVKAVEERTEDIMFWASTDVLHKARAEAYETNNIWDEAKDSKSNIEALDDKWSYAAFEKILKKNEAEAPKFLSKLLGEWLLEGISDYKPKSDGDAKTNRYYWVILDYIVSTNNEWLLGTYLNHVVVDDVINTKYLWTDTENQKINFNKIIDKWTILPESENGKILMKIKLQLINTDKKGFQETLSKGLDSLIETFGPLLCSVLKMFGMGKWSLLKMFGKAYEKQINEIYSKEYGLSWDQITAINEIVNSRKDWTTEVFSKDAPKDGSGNTLILDTWDQVKSAFGDTKQDEYVNILMNETNKYYQNINVDVLQKWLDIYEKEKNEGKDININDIIDIKTDSARGKKSITQIKENKTDIFKNILKGIVNSDTTRTAIATANYEIKTETKDKKEIGTGLNEQGLDINNTATYKINNQQDIARYLTASLFSDKDLGYVMTENKLNDRIPQVIVTPPPPEKIEVTPTPTLTFKEEFAKGGIVTEAGAKKMIHEVLDYATAPDNLLFIPNWKNTPRKIEKKKGIELKDKNKTKVDSYVYTEEPNKWERVQIVKWDKIEAIKNTPEFAALETKVATFKTEYAKIKEWVYNEKFRLNTYEYTTSPDANQKEYENNILTPLKDFFEQFYTDTKKVDNKYTSEHVKEEKFDINNLQIVDIKEDYMINVKNMLIQMWWANKTYQTNIVDKMKDIITEENKYTQTFKDGKTEITIKDKTWTKTLWTLKFWYTEDNNKTRTLTPEWIATTV